MLFRSAEDAASPVYTTITSRSSTLSGVRIGDAPPEPYDGAAPLETVIEAESATPDLRTAVEIGQALEQRLPGTPNGIVDAFRRAYPVPRLADLSAEDANDPGLVRVARVCGGRTTHGLAALSAARASAPGVPPGVDLPTGTAAVVEAALAWFVAWVDETYGPIGTDDAPAWRPDRLEYASGVAATAPDGSAVDLSASAGTHGEFDWYAFDQDSFSAPTGPVGSAGSASVTTSVLPTPVRMSGMPDPRWWNFEDGRVNWANVDTDRRDLARLMVVDFMLVQSNDWFIVPFGHAVGSLVSIDQLLVRDVFGGWTVVDRADAATATGPPATGRQHWAMYATATADGGLAGYSVLPPSALRTTIDGPDIEEVRFVRDEQANLVWAVETITEDGAGRPWPGTERAARGEAPPPAVGSDASAAPDAATAGMPYRLQTTVPVNWIPFLPVQIDDARRAVALERAAMQRDLDGVLTAVQPVGRVLRPSAPTDPDVYRIREEEVARGGTRVLRAVHRTRWVDGSTLLWTARRRRAGLGGVASGLRYDVTDS